MNSCSIALHLLCAGLIGVVLPPGLAAAADTLIPDTTDEEVLELETVIVTGTRIKRTDVEGALPVTVIDRQLIELSGESSVADYLRSLSFNTYGSYRSQLGTGGMGSTKINLRGMGSNRSLVLVDGRRLPKWPVSSADQNLNSIPMGSVERIEVLSDGASAIYGSDAIAGVINIITRDDYDGWELMYGRGDTHTAGGDRSFGSVMFGQSGSDWNLIATFSWNKRDMTFSRAFDWNEPETGPFGNNFTTTEPQSGIPYFNFTAIPGGCSGSDAYFLVPFAGSLSGEACAYDASRVEAIETSVDTRGLLVKAEYDIGKQWSAWLNTSASETESAGWFAPDYATSFWWDAPIPVDSPNNPTNPGSAFHDPAFGPNVPVHYWHYFEPLGDRQEIIETKLRDLQLGMTGGLREAQLDFGIRVTRSSTDDLTSNMLNPDAADAYIQAGAYDLHHPAATPDEVLNAMKKDYRWWWNFDQNELFGTASWDLFDIGGVSLKWVLGGERRQEMWDFDSTYRGFGAPASARRNVSSLFFESLLPLRGGLELSLAGRYDDYSDWGGNFSPKLSLRWRVAAPFVLRASYGEGFRAPELSIQAVGSDEFPDLTNVDLQSCEVLGMPPGCDVYFWHTHTVSPELGAEQSEQYSLGLVWQPLGRFDLALDYYSITLDERIQDFWPDLILIREQLDQPLPAGFGVTRDPATGLLLSITSGWGNLGRVETSGLDFNANLNFRMGPGRWVSNLQATHVLEDVWDGLDFAGLSGSPRTRATLSNHYDIAHFILAWNIQFISRQEGDVEGYSAGIVPRWITHDLQLSWSAPWNGALTVGAQNAFDKQPALDVGPTVGGRYNTALYDGFGRIVYARYTQTF
jgi:iron complex outermembrane receptor protein